MPKATRKRRPKSDWQKEVRILMIEHDLTQDQLSEAIGFERTRVTKVINEQSLAPEIADAINAYLNVKTPYPYQIPENSVAQ
jgi:transcriptional regulator with XRE-family HTH domain